MNWNIIHVPKYVLSSFKWKQRKEKKTSKFQLPEKYFRDDEEETRLFGVCLSDMYF